MKKSTEKKTENLQRKAHKEYKVAQNRNPSGKIKSHQEAIQ